MAASLRAIQPSVFQRNRQASGIDATDWSWSVLLADFDNDGWKDMHVTNGIGTGFYQCRFPRIQHQNF